MFCNINLYIIKKNCQKIIITTGNNHTIWRHIRIESKWASLFFGLRYIVRHKRIFFFTIFYFCTSIIFLLFKLYFFYLYLGGRGDGKGKGEEFGPKNNKKGLKKKVCKNLRASPLATHFLCFLSLPAHYPNKIKPSTTPSQDPHVFKRIFPYFKKKKNFLIFFFSSWFPSFF